jgi:hypothetical protein
MFFLSCTNFHVSFKYNKHKVLQKMAFKMADKPTAVPLWVRYWGPVFCWNLKLNIIIKLYLIRKK